MISGLTYEGVTLRSVRLALMKLRREALAFGAPRRNRAGMWEGMRWFATKKRIEFLQRVKALKG